MKKVTVLGAGFVTKPAVDYFLDQCGYQVTVTSLKKSESERLIAGRENGVAFAWSEENEDLLDLLVSESDIVMSMVPPPLHPLVAKACLKHQKDMVTTSYISPNLEALDQLFRESGILALNEIGEDPGLDTMITKRMIDRIKDESGRILSVNSYGAGVPAFEHNNNPWGYKFSWSPTGLIAAAKSSAAYLEKGKRIEIASGNIFDHHWLVDLDNIGTFETYPNRDSEKYLECLGLDKDISFYRGLLRYTGWCNTMKCLIDLNLLDDTMPKEFNGKSYQEFMLELIGAEIDESPQRAIAEYLGLKPNDDSLKKLAWLGLFRDDPVHINKGTNSDLLLNLMLQKLSYAPNEQDMVIIYTEIIADFKTGIEKRVSSLVMKGQVGGDSAMSRAVSLPAAFAAERILQKKTTLKGIQRPTDPEIYNPVLEKLDDIGFHFSTKTVKM